jgi:hypothetical protein
MRGGCGDLEFSQRSQNLEAFVDRCDENTQQFQERKSFQGRGHGVAGECRSRHFSLYHTATHYSESPLTGCATGDKALVIPPIRIVPLGNQVVTADFETSGISTFLQTSWQLTTDSLLVHR